jgi:glycerophosphoryl diester phosphodiesterase
MSDLTWLTERPIAHRGFHDMNRRRWENTLPAFEAALQRGYAIECDVHLAMDGVPVVVHDEELRRLTGHSGHVWQRTSRELAALRVGGTEARVPLLADLLDLVDGRVPLVIELKGVPGHDDGLAGAAVSALRAYRGPAALMSFDHWLIRALATHAGPLPYGLTAMGTAMPMIEAHFSMLAHGIHFTSYHVMDLPNPFVTFMRARLGLPAISWTVRDEDGAQRSRLHADQMTFEGFEPQT